MIGRILQVFSRCIICGDPTPHRYGPLWEHYRFTILAWFARAAELSLTCVLLVVFAWFCLPKEEETA